MASSTFSYVAVLDYDHLDNGLFLTNFAQSIAKQENMRRVVLHGDSAYTERIMQTGVMREEAQVRSIKDLNRRLVALLADEGVPATGIDGYQRKFVVLKNGELTIDTEYFQSLPPQPVLLVSNLIWDADKETTRVFPLSDLAKALNDQLHLDSAIVFRPESDSGMNQESSRESRQLQWKDLAQEQREQLVPAEFKEARYPLHVATPHELRQLPDLSECLIIE